MWHVHLLHCSMWHVHLLHCSMWHVHLLHCSMWHVHLLHCSMWHVHMLPPMRMCIRKHILVYHSALGTARHHLYNKKEPTYWYLSSFYIYHVVRMFFLYICCGHVPYFLNFICQWPMAYYLLYWQNKILTRWCSKYYHYTIQVSLYSRIVCVLLLFNKLPKNIASTVYRIYSI